MNKQCLPKSFFRENPLAEMSAAEITYFSMTDGLSNDVQNFITEETKKVIEPARLAKIEQEKIDIAQIDSAELLVKWMRSDYDIMNRELICEKALNSQEEVIPLILKRFQTTMQDSFIECTMQILARVKRTYIKQCAEQYQHIRSPYAQSMVSLAFAVHELDETIPLLVKEYQRFQREYPEESYDQGPLLALYILHGMA